MAKNQKMAEDQRLDSIQKALKLAMAVPIQALPLYLRWGGRVLPGISQEGGQVLTKDEMAKLSKNDALRCRMTFVIKYAASQNEEKCKTA